MIVQATSRVAHTLPPAEQFSAGDTTENIAIFPVVQEQVLVQAIPRLVGSSPPVDEFTAYVAMRPLPLGRGAAVCTSTAAYRGRSRRARTVGADPRSSCAADGGLRDGHLAVTGSTDCRAGYRSADSFLALRVRCVRVFLNRS